MDNIVVRSRYPRHSVPSRKKKKYTRESVGFRDKLAMQTLVCILLLMTAGIIRSVNTPVTSFLSNAIKGALTYNMEPEKIYRSVDNVVYFLTRKRLLKQEDTIPKHSPVDDEYIDDELMDDFHSVQQTAVLGDQYPPEQKPQVSTSVKQEEPKAAQAVKAQPTAQPTPAAQASAKTQSSTGTPSAVANSPFIVPVGGALGSPYGERIDPLTNVLKFHKGIDIEANHGTSIKAAMAGDVIEAAQEKTLGNYVRIKHSGGYTTTYAHCSQLLVKAGQKVKQGDIIAKVGNTGASTGAHLHFEIWKDDKHVNPLNYIKVPEK